MAKIIRVDDEVYQKLKEMGQTGDSFNDVLRKVLGLPPKEKRSKKKAENSEG